MQDQVVSARGVTVYVQTVLVLELAVRLITEDIMVDDEEARKIMRDSVGIGEIEDVVILQEGADGYEN